MELTEIQNQIIKEIAKKNGYQEFRTDVQQATQKGDNFLGILSRIKIIDKSRNLGLIMKCASTSEVQRKIQPIREVFLREMYIYETIFKEFAAYEEEQNISNKFIAYAKLFETNKENNSELLVLEDLKEKGYQMCDRKSTMNFCHIEAVLKQYANFHAISLAMNCKNPDKFQNLTENLNDVFRESMKKNGADFAPAVKSIFSNLFKCVEDDQDATEALKKFQNVIMKAGLQEIDPNDLLVVIHGDCWCNNLLFKYEDTDKEKPSDVRIVDWQLSKLGSPGADLTYFLFANGSEEILNDYKKYLRLYYDVLCQKLVEFSCDPQQVFPYEALENQFNKHSLFTLFMCAMVMKLQICEPDEAPDFSRDIKEASGFSNVMNFNVSNIDEYHRRLGCIVKFLLKNNLFDILDGRTS